MRLCLYIHWKQKVKPDLNTLRLYPQVEKRPTTTLRLPHLLQQWALAKFSEFSSVTHHRDLLLTRHGNVQQFSSTVNGFQQYRSAQATSYDAHVFNQMFTIN